MSPTNIRKLETFVNRVTSIASLDAVTPIAFDNGTVITAFGKGTADGYQIIKTNLVGEGGNNTVMISLANAFGENSCNVGSFSYSELESSERVSQIADMIKIITGYGLDSFDQAPRGKPVLYFEKASRVDQRSV